MVDKDNLHLTKYQNEKKIEFLSNLKKELENLKYQRKHIKKTNFEIGVLRLSKIMLRILKKVSPYVTTAMVSFMIFKYLNHTPFIYDEKEKKLQIQKEFDSLGNVRYERQYEDFSNSENRIQVISEWKKANGNYYEREIKVYAVNRLSKKRITDLINENNLSLDSILGEPILVKTEKRNNLTVDEISSPPFVQAITYSYSKDDTIIVREGKFENNNYTLLWSLINILLDIFLGIALSNANNEELTYYIRRIKKEFPKLNPEELDKIIEIKQNNYNRLMR